MSLQFGSWNFDGRAPDAKYVEEVSAMLATYGPDSCESYSKDGVWILYCAFHTTKESHRETQPLVSGSGAVITWDGRLDNRADLIGQVGKPLSAESTDVEIVAAAYDRWGNNCLSQLSGDWALSVYKPRDRSLLLAKDPIGTKHLYYSIEEKLSSRNDWHAVWSTILDPLVRFSERTITICEEYIAGWFATKFPAAHLTPYEHIHAVPASSFVVLQPGNNGLTQVTKKFWEFDAGKRIRYRTDAEYEEHFRTIFAQAVRRRLRSDRPVLAELSGGMDSSSIVCMADLVIARGQAECPRLDTISWFDGCNPGLDELPYLVKVEQKRGRTGFHIDLRELETQQVGTHRALGLEYDDSCFAVTPFRCRLTEMYRLYREHMRSQGHRVILSGVAGDDIMGGEVPTPTPELQDLLATAQFVRLTRQLSAWAAKMRKPRIPLLWEALRSFFLASPFFVIGGVRSCPWFRRGFVRRNSVSFRGYPTRTTFFGPLPSFQENMKKLSAIRRVIAYFDLLSDLPREVRFPYVDRDLIEFMYAIPREQTVGVGKRRFLMKRSMAGIDPYEILDRRQQSVTVPDRKKEESEGWQALKEIELLISSHVGLVDPNRFLTSLRRTQNAQIFATEQFLHTITLERWLGNLKSHGVQLKSASREAEDQQSLREIKELCASVRPKSSAS